MHVLYLHQYFCPPDGSSGTRSYEMARRIAAAGHRVTMVCSGANFAHHNLPDGRSERVIDGIQVVILNVPYSNRMGHLERIKAFVRFAEGARRAARGVPDVDVVFATSTPLTVAYPGISASRKHRCPMVFEVRDLWPELPIAVGALRDPVSKACAHWLERWAYRNSAHIVALSPGMKEGVAKAGYPEALITVVPNSSDIATFRVPESEGRRFLDAHPPLDTGKLVTYAGALGVVNGVDFLADLAAATLDLDPDVRFCVVGDGKQRERIEARARELGVLDRNFWMLPPVPKTMMPAVLSASTACASLLWDWPVLKASSPNKVFDAFAAARPVLISYGGWIEDLLAETGAGIRVGRDDAGAAARQLVAFLSDPVALQRAREASARLADERFSRDLLAAQLIGVLERVASDTRR